MASLGPKKKTLTDEILVNIARHIAHHLEQNPDLYATDGLLRMAASEQSLKLLSKTLIQLPHRPARIAETLARHHINGNELAHAYVGVLKRLLINEGPSLFISANPAWATLRAAFEQNDTALFGQGLEKLLNGSAKDKNAAESLYHFLHIATKTNAFEARNRMNLKATAVVINPTIDAFLFANDDDDMAYLSRMADMEAFCQSLIQSRAFSLAFDEGRAYLGFNEDQLQRIYNDNYSLKKKLTAQIQDEMAKGESADQTKIARINRSLADVIKRTHQLDKALPKGRSKHFARMDSSEQINFLNDLLAISGQSAISDALVGSNSTDLLQMHTVLTNKYGPTTNTENLDEALFNHFRDQGKSSARPAAPTSSSSRP